MGGGQVQVVLIGLDEHLGCVAGSGELAVVHEWREDGLWLGVFGLGVPEEAAELVTLLMEPRREVAELLLPCAARRTRLCAGDRRRGRR